MKFLLTTLVGLIICATGEKVTYDNYKVFKITPNSDEQVQLLGDLRKDGSYEFWTDVINVGGDVRIMVGPENVNEFIQYTAASGISVVEVIADVQKLIDAQRIPASSNGRSAGSFSWDRYHELESIHAWLDELAEEYPNVVNTVTIGTSHEGRPIKGVVIDFRRGARGDRPLTGMIEGGIHAREWISPATVTWIINEFLTSNDNEVRFMAEEFIWHIFPVVNPDGYAYTFTNNRMWRKNRNPENFVNCSSNNDLGNGIDLNRNFDFVWMSTGASSNPCDQTYAGPSGSSEVETRAISNYVLTLAEHNNVIFYFAFHSYSQMILVPYSHVTGQDKLQARNYGDLYEVAMRGADRLSKTHGTPYVVGVSAEILYAVSGSSFDWAYGVANIPIVYLFELRDVGEYGFLLLPEEIIPNNQEIMACLVEMEKTTRKLNYYTAGSSVVIHSLTLILGAVAFGIHANY